MSSLAPPINVVAPNRPPVGRPPRGKARVHSLLVRILRIVLPLIMVGMVGLLVYLVAVHAVRRHASAHRDAASPIRMVNPHFFGRDSQGRAYMLGARQAARDESSFQTVRLSYPTITLDVNGAHPSNLTADSGVYHEDTRILYLAGHVRADNAKQSSFATDQATVDTKTGSVVGGAPLASRTPVGEVQSNGFNVYNKGDRVIFKGGVHARLNQH